MDARAGSTDGPVRRHRWAAATALLTPRPGRRSTSSAKSSPLASSITTPLSCAFRMQRDNCCPSQRTACLRTTSGPSRRNSQSPTRSPLPRAFSTSSSGSAISTCMHHRSSNANRFCARNASKRDVPGSRLKPMKAVPQPRNGLPRIGRRTDERSRRRQAAERREEREQREDRGPKGSENIVRLNVVQACRVQPRLWFPDGHPNSSTDGHPNSPT